jgi:hypothetical protein
LDEEVVLVPAREGIWTRLDGLLTRLGERLNPIVVKEARQAMKSKQFVITFSLLLVCGWLWSMWNVALIGPDIWFKAAGRQLFMGYYFILAIPLLVIVPYAAFRSLASECEDRTYELLSITTLSPRQIVAGKLASSVLQMLVYFSALAPGLVFTYLLRGIDMPTILFILAWTFAASLALSMFSLMVATLTQERHWQILLSVLLVLGLALMCYAGILISFGILFGMNLVSNDPEFWSVNAFVATMYLGVFVLVFLAAAAQLTVPSENRSTPLRWAMLALHVLFAGWMGWVWLDPGRYDADVLVVLLWGSAVFWFFMGALMTGESSELSPRVKRQLPQSVLGRIFLTWFNPGPHTGYVFALANAATSVLVAAGAALLISAIGAYYGTRPRGFGPGRVALCGLMLVSYLAIYLSLGQWAVRQLRRAGGVGLFVTLLVHCIGVFLGVLLPMFVYLMSRNLRGGDYSLLHAPNVFWTLHEVQADRLRGDAFFVLLLVPFAGAIALLLNLRPITAELRHVRIAKPARVAEEDAELAAKDTAPVHTNPWD